MVVVLKFRHEGAQGGQLFSSRSGATSEGSGLPSLVMARGVARRVARRLRLELPLDFHGGRQPSIRNGLDSVGYNNSRESDSSVVR